MKLTIQSKKLGRPLTFSRPGESYIFVDINGYPGTLGKQICKGGDTIGNTIEYSGSDYSEFKRICQNWYRLYTR